MKRLLWRKVLLAGIATVFLLASAARGYAHHSFAATYNSTDEVLEIEGTVRELVWRNPHSFLRIDVTEADGSTRTWALEWGSISQLAESDLTRTTLRPGDHVIAKGDPSRDSSSPRLLLRELRRPSDGWEWAGRVR
jgi:hypothetical protein